VSGNNRNHRIAVGTAFAAAVLASTPTARADDMQISIDGLDLFPTAGNTATADSAMADIAIGNGATAAAAPSDLDPFEDLFGDSGINTWTTSADASLPSTTAGSLDATVDAFHNDGIPPAFENIIGQLDPSAYAVDLTGPEQGDFPADPLGDLATTLDFSLYTSGLAPTLDPAILDTFNVAEGILLSPLLLLAGFFA
jgi:hypothetical protein